MKSPHSFSRGQILGDTYRLEKLLGCGGMGEIWEAQHLRLPKKVAIKVLHHAGNVDDELFQRFKREAFIASSLRHPNIIEVLDFNLMENGTPYLVMELLIGSPLSARMASKPMPWPDVKPILEQIASALGACHEKGIIHRDLKPDNVFLVRLPNGTDEVKLLDFGISKIQDSLTRHTMDNSMMGTAYYMAPEQAAGKSSQVNPTADVFSLGAITYEMLTGTPPFGGSQLAEIIYKLVHTPHVPLRERMPELPKQLQDTIDKALSKSPNDRPEDALEFWRCLSGNDFTVNRNSDFQKTVTRRSIETRNLRNAHKAPRTRFWAWSLGVFVGLAAIGFGFALASGKPQASATVPSAPVVTVPSAPVVTAPKTVAVPDTPVPSPVAPAPIVQRNRQKKKPMAVTLPESEALLIQEVEATYKAGKHSVAVQRAQSYLLSVKSTNGKEALNRLGALAACRMRWDDKAGSLFRRLTSRTMKQEVKKVCAQEGLDL